jgi:trehalose utilization protein
MNMLTNVLIWNEYEDERQVPESLKANPGGIHAVLAGFLKDTFAVRTAIWGEEGHGLSDEALRNTDVLIWYSHRHNPIPQETIRRLIDRVFEGMGVIFLHSAVFSEFAQQLIGPGARKGAYREVGELERVWVLDRSHPVADGLPDHFEIPESEMYPEPRDIPTPDDLVFLSWFEGGEVLRSGYSYSRGAGKVFCFLSGHSTFRIYQIPEVQAVIRNAAAWCTPRQKPPEQSRSGEVGFDYRTIEHGYAAKKS